MNTKRTSSIFTQDGRQPCLDWHVWLLPVGDETDSCRSLQWLVDALLFCSAERGRHRRRATSSVDAADGQGVADGVASGVASWAAWCIGGGCGIGGGVGNAGGVAGGAVGAVAGGAVGAVAGVPGPNSRLRPRPGALRVGQVRGGSVRRSEQPTVGHPVGSPVGPTPAGNAPRYYFPNGPKRCVFLSPP